MSELALIAALHQFAGQLVTPQLAHALVAQLYPERAVDCTQFSVRTCEGFTFQAESLRAILPELHTQHLAHWGETERYRAGSAMNPDYEHMKRAEQAGNLVQFTVRENGALVGNLRVYLYRDLHTQEPAANEDTLFLSPPARRGFTASRFIAYVEECLVQLQVVDAYVDAKILHDAQGNVIRDVGALLRRARYRHVANRFHKRLTKG